MSRLLFAAARGARVERKHYSFKSYWEEARMVWAKEPKDCDYEYRIHPDDEALQYGPISTALREHSSEYPEHKSRPYNSAAIVEWASDSDWDLPECQRDVPLFLLILAEALADEGL